MFFNPATHPEENSWLNQYFNTPLDTFVPALAVQYCYILILVATESMAWYTGIFLAIFTLNPETGKSARETVSALVMSSFGKFIPITSIIWTLHAKTAFLEIENQLLIVSQFVTLCNIQAVSIFLDLGYFSSVLVLSSAFIARYVAGLAWRAAIGISFESH
ncbi:MAG: hypothetical protein SGCHY_003146 [Lobulomycetales sp.]